MGQILHGCATTTQVTRREIQDSEASIRSLAREHGVDRNTVLKWRKRDFVHDAPMGPKNPRSTVLSHVEEEVCVVFRCHTLLPLDDCPYSLQGVIPHLSRASLWRCFRRQGINRLPEEETQKAGKKRFSKYPVGYFHIDIAEVRTEEGVLQLFVAIGRTRKYAYAQLFGRKTKAVAAAFPRDLIARVPCSIHTILTDNGIRFANRRRGRNVPVHDFDRVCRDNGIGHRLTKVGHPRTNGQVERMNRTIKAATVSDTTTAAMINSEAISTGFLTRTTSPGALIVERKNSLGENHEMVEKRTGKVYNETVGSQSETEHLNK